MLLCKEAASLMPAYVKIPPFLEDRQLEVCTSDFALFYLISSLSMCFISASQPKMGAVPHMLIRWSFLWTKDPSFLERCSAFLSILPDTPEDIFFRNVFFQQCSKIPRFQIVLKNKEWLKPQLLPWPFHVLQLIFPSLCFACKLPGCTLACTALTSFHLTASYPHRFHPCPSCSSRAHCQRAPPALLSFSYSSLPQHLYICQYGYTCWCYLFFSQFGALLTLASFSHSSQPDRTDQGTTETISAGEYKKERPREVLRGTDSARRRKKEPEPFLLTGTPPAAALCPLLTYSVPPPSPWSPLWDLFTTCLNQEAYQGIPGSPGDRFREKTY